MLSHFSSQLSDESCIRGRFWQLTDAEPTESVDRFELEAHVETRRPVLSTHLNFTVFSVVPHYRTPHCTTQHCAYMPKAGLWAVYRTPRKVPRSQPESLRCRSSRLRRRFRSTRPVARQRQTATSRNRSRKRPKRQCAGWSSKNSFARCAPAVC